MTYQWVPTDALGNPGVDSTPGTFFKELGGWSCGGGGRRSVKHIAGGEKLAVPAGSPLFLKGEDQGGWLVSSALSSRGAGAGGAGRGTVGWVLEGGGIGGIVRSFRTKGASLLPL